MKKLYLYTIALLMISSCSKSDSIDSGGSIVGIPNKNSEWLIPRNEVHDGGPGKDGIPALENPDMIPISDAVDYILDDDLVLGIVQGNSAKAYAMHILDWHEIINDKIGNKNIAITYCPLTGTGLGWDRTINGVTSTFGVSGLIYNSNLIPYDRLTNSNWSQMLSKSVNGIKSGNNIQTYNLFETTLATWRAMFPDSQINTENTGHQRDYQSYPYGHYPFIDDMFLFPVSHLDDRIPNKEKVLGIIINEKSKAYRFENFGNGISVLEDQFQNTELLIAGSTDHQFMVVFNSNLSGTMLSFTTLQNSFPAIVIDNEGTTWDAFGRGVDGPRKGMQLDSPMQYMGYWFAWASFFPQIEIYSN
jgi:hypothetical protein